MLDWRSRARIPADWICVLLIVATLTIAYWPVLASGNGFPRHPGSNDWLKECALNQLPREAILRDRQFPLRTQYLGGGYPSVAYPEDSSLSPLFVTTLLLGENVGLKVKGFIKLLVGGLGMYHLLRVVLCCPPGGALLGALMFGLSAWFHTKTRAGWIGPQNYYFVPLMMGLLIEAARGRRSVLLPALLFALLLVDGKFSVAISLLFLGLWGLLELVQIRRGEIVLRPAFLQKLALAVALGCLLSMVKILPMLDLLSVNSRALPYNDLARPWATVGETFYELHSLREGLEVPPVLNKSGVGLGWVPVALAVLGAALSLRYLARWVVLLVVFVWLSMGYHAPFDLWRLIYHLPVFGSLNKPAFWLDFFILMPLCVLAACLFREGIRAKRARIAYVAYLCAGAVGVALLLQNAYRINAKAFSEGLGAAPTYDTFFHIKGNGRYHTYHNVVGGVGTLDWDGDILLPECAVPRFFVVTGEGLRQNPSYRGEVWLVDGVGEARLTRLTPNAIDVEVDAPEGASIVVNQNFHPGWRSSHGRVLPRRGVITVVGIPAGGPRIVRLSYSSPAFAIGLAVTVASLGVALCMGLKRLRTCGLRGCLAGTESPAGGRTPEVQIAFGAWSARKRRLAGAVLAVAIGVLLLLAVPVARTDYVLHSAELLEFTGGTDRTDRAAEMCQAVLRRDPDNRLAHEILGSCYYREARWVDAVGELGPIMQLGAKHLESYLYLALAYENLGELEQANGVWREFLFRAPYYRGVWEMIEARGLILPP